MQDRPDKAALLEAVAGFLLRDLRPHIKDPALSFRVLIASNLAQVIATETRLEDGHDEAQMGRLRRLLPDVDVTQLAGSRRRSERTLALRTLDSTLAARVRAGEISETQMPAVWSHVTETLREKLQVVNPRFDTQPVLEH